MAPGARRDRARNRRSDDAAGASDRRDRLTGGTVNNPKLSPANIVILAGGVVILIGSFLGFYKLDLPAVLGGSRNYSAWSTSQFMIATLPALLGVVMAAQVALDAFTSVNIP